MTSQKKTLPELSSFEQPHWSPSAFVVMPFSEPYDQMYAASIKPTFEAHGIRLVRADEISRSTPVIDDIESAISSCDLVVIEASTKNQNVYFEFGLAFAKKKEIILLAEDATALPFDTRHIRHLVYTPSDADALSKKLAEWIGQTRVFNAIQKREVSSTLLRGEVFSGFFDSCTHLAKNQSSREDQLESEIRNATMVGCHHAYETDKGALHWLNLCADPLYSVFYDSIQHLSSNASRVIDVIVSGCGVSNPDFVSLGPGNGYKDKVLLRALTSRTSTNKSSRELFYYPVDVSPRILGSAIYTVMRDPQIAKTVRVKAIHSEFSLLPTFKPVFDYRPEPNVFALLGNTLGNMQNELSFLRTLKSTMNDGDILMLEVRTGTQSLALGGHDDDQVGLSFSPLARLGVKFEPQEIFRKEEAGFSQVSGTRTLSTRYRKAVIGAHTHTDIFLSCVNYYDADALAETLRGESLNFEILHQSITTQLALFVLQKTAGRAD